MKKLLAIFIGIMALSTATMAKEVTEKPIVAKEAEVQEFKRTGYLDVSARYYGRAEDGIEGVSNGNEGARVQYLFGLELDEKNRVELRVRDHYNLNDADSAEKRRDDTEFRLRAFHKHGSYTTSRVQILGRGNSTSPKNFRYDYMVDVTRYGFDNKLIKTKSMTIAPNVGYWHKNNGDSWNVIGADLFTYHALPADINLEVNLYGHHNSDNGFAYNVETYIYRNWQLHTFKNGVNMMFKLEGGLDDYSSVAYKSFSKLSENKEDGNYSVYAYPRFNFTKGMYYADLGAEYRNFGSSSKRHNSDDWKVQPTVTVGAKYTF